MLNDRKKPKKRSITPPCIYSIPNPVFAYILSRVPSKNVILCKSVSKTFLDEINNPFFKQQLFSNSPISPLLIINPSDQITQTPLTLHLIQGESLTDLDRNRHANSSPIKILKGFKSPLVTCSIRVLKTNLVSCEGLICTAPRGIYSDHVIISNPLTEEYVRIQLYQVCRRSSSQEKHLISYFIGLGFSKTGKEFKLIRLSKIGSTCWVELCLVGTDVWRRVEIPVMDGNMLGKAVNDVMYVNGVIYWTYDGYNSICSFDFDCEEFRFLTLPSEIICWLDKGCNIGVLGVLGGSLCVSMVHPFDVDLSENFDLYENLCVELWIVEKDGMEWNWKNLLDINIEEGYIKEKEKLCKESNLVLDLGCFKAIKYMEGEKILLHDDQDVFMIYDLATTMISLIRVLDDRLCDFGKSSTFGVVPHVASLVSLRDTLKIEDSNMVEKYYPNGVSII